MEAKVSLKLKRGNALLMGAHGMEGLNPLPQSDMGAMHNRSYRHSELLPALVALDHAVPSLFAIQPCYVLAFAMRAFDAFRPSDFFQDIPRLIFGQTTYVYRCHFC
jgi:hypothetical protein